MTNSELLRKAGDFHYANPTPDTEAAFNRIKEWATTQLPPLCRFDDAFDRTTCITTRAEGDDWPRQQQEASAWLERPACKTDIEFVLLCLMQGM